MLLIPCPYCGKRDEHEFTYAREGHIARPANGEQLSDAITALAKRHAASPLRKGGRRYRLVAAAHPALQTKATKRNP